MRAGIAVLEQRYRVRVAPDVVARCGYLAGDDERRADELVRYFRDPDVRAVILARGGYGLMRILDRLDADALRADPKLLVGFSDATALLAWARVNAGLRCVHGPMAAQLGELPESDVAWLFDLLESTRPPGPVDLDLQPIGHPAATPPEPLEGPLLGGNLCLLTHLLGTPYCPDYTGSVLFLEEVGERPYRVDRDLTQLGLAGVLDAVAGALIGDLTDCVETVHDDHPGALEVVDERLRSYRVAGLRGVPAGHGARNLALPIGARCALDHQRGRLHLLEPAVAPP